jgi:hypothetical protein
MKVGDITEFSDEQLTSLKEKSPEDIIRALNDAGLSEKLIQTLGQGEGVIIKIEGTKLTCAYRSLSPIFVKYFLVEFINSQVEQEKVTSPQLGKEMTTEEEERISGLSAENKEREIQTLCDGVAGELTEKQLESLRVMLRLAYKHPDRYARLPGPSSVKGMSRPFPYRGL